MDLVSYLKDQIEFLSEQFKDAKNDQNETMAYLVESRLDEAKKIMTAVNKGQIDRLS
ncbi:hypothetical protein [Secundilactobacillus malefermentans]|uniref:Uncharacterized protein n=1 Tax=Secundilactobacillus malefermentans TaxID=176292 RepID=A0A4R5NPD2_9LACO|nr:hypothetical protein [Secundilactobacillus malefermentans]KRM57928.1 hypothetical protein FD44_GL000906 [Secundilactobacillus malefermentans DSM 5705 = KCTC 3548]TDG78471.1 hypothetical protein C5L31_001087 [Secundilactobacillus malefermentans]